MTTHLTSPTYPVPDREATVIFNLTESTANYVRVWVTVAPEGSDLAEKLKQAAQNRVQIYEGDAGINHPFRFLAGKGGKYTLIAQEYKRGSASGGGYQFSPDTAVSETKLGTEATLSLFIGQRLSHKIGVGADTATLVLWTWDDHIRKTTLAVQGEDTPTIVATSPTPKAKAAIESTAVRTALADLVPDPEIAVATAVGDLGAVVIDLHSRLNGHNSLGSSHFAADNDNLLKTSFASAQSPAELPSFVNNALQLMRRHRTNDHGGKPTADPPEPPGVESATYHKISGSFKADFVNMPLYQGVGSLEEAYGALADIWRAHQAHRVNLLVHTAVDSTNAMTALPKLLEVHRQFLTVLAATSPPAPPAQSDGAMTLIARAGFSETPR